MELEDSQESCYVEDKDSQYKIVRIVRKDIDTVSGATTYTCQDDVVSRQQDTAGPFKVSASKTHPLSTKEDLLDPPQDLVLMAVVNNPGILQAVRSRFLKDEIHTSIGSILINVNPFKWIKGLYETSVMEKYRDGIYVLGQQPHVFAIACRAHESLIKGANQSIIISGESGAGKTEATKQCLNYLAHCAGGTSDIQSKILKTSPVLEAWGNAKTLRNNNSSRFGKFIEVWFNDNFTIRGASNTTYLLEKNRVISQSNGERNYHIFYQMLFGASGDLLKALKLQEMAAMPNTAKYIAGVTKIDDVDDAKDFVELMRAYQELGFDSDHIEVLFRVLAGILHMGNVSYVSNPEDSDQCLVGEDRVDWLGRAADMWGVEYSALKKGLLFRTVQAGGAGRRGSVTMKAFNLAAAYQNKDAIVKDIYGRCFERVVRTINDELDASGGGNGSPMIGVLDIFGFEIFPNNSFEQLCINLANESLQQHFNFNIFRAEMELYKSEDVVIPKLDFQDNQDVLDLIIKRRQGLFAMLDDECLIPKGDWNGFYNKITKQYASHPRFMVSKTMGHEFTIKHYAGDVAYDPSLFLEKNKDTVSEDLVGVLRGSRTTFISQLFMDLGDDEDDSPSRGTLVTAAAATAKATVGKKFVKQLEDLMVALNKTSSQYVRCIKANHIKKPNIFDSRACYEQLNYSGVFEAVIIMKKGYPFRLKLEQFRQRFHVLTQTDEEREAIFDLTPAWKVYPEPLQKLYPPVSREYCQKLIDIAASRAPDLCNIHVGRSLVFYRSEQNILLERLRRDKMLPAVRMVQRLLRGALSFRLVSRAVIAMHKCEEATINTDVASLRSMAKELIDCGNRLRNTTGCVIDLEMGYAVDKYADALMLEQEVISELTPILASRQALIDNYHRIEGIMSRIARINFRTTVRGKTFAVEVEDNPVLVKASAIIKKHTSIFKLRQGLDEGIRNKDELQLQSALRRLRQLQIEGIVDQNFCVEEIFLANDIVKHGVSKLNKFLDFAGADLSTGRLRTNREGGLLQVTVDASPLASFVSSQQVQQAVQSGHSKMVQAFLATCEKMSKLRSQAQKKEWRGLWQSLQETWRNYLLSSGPAGAAERRADSPFIPESLDALVRDEIVTMFLCCIELGLLPQLLAAADECRLHPQIDADQGTSSQARVLTALADMEPFEKYFDSTLLNVYKTTEELVLLRVAVASGSGSAIEEALRSMHLLTRDHPEYIFASQSAAYYLSVQRLCQSLLSDGPAGSPGALRFGSIGLDAQGAALAVAEPLPCSSEMWRRLLTASKVVFGLRSLLSQGDVDAATELLAGVNLSAFPWVRLRSSVVLISSPAVEESIAAALAKGNKEIDLCTRELNHRKAERELLEAVRAGALRGEIGSIVNVTEVSGAALRSALDASQRLLIPSDESEMLLRDCSCLQVLRDSVSSGDWAAAEAVVVPFFKATDELQVCVPAARAELKLIYDEVFDLKIRTKIINALSCDQIMCDGNNSVLNSRVDTGALVDALEIHGDYVFVSFETKYIALTAKLLCAMRQAVYENRWEPDGFMSHDIAMRDFVEFASLLDKSYPKAVPKMRMRHAKIAQDVVDIERLSVPSEAVMATEAEDFDESCDWAMSDLLAFASNVGVHPSGAAEVESIRRIAYERRLRFVLLLAVSSGRVDGSIDNLQVGCVEYDQLMAALNYANTYAHFASPVVYNWQAAAHELLHSRMAVKSAYGGDGSEGPRRVSDRGTRQLISYIDTKDIKRVIHETEGYPTYELRLIMDYVTDQLHLREVLECLHFGACCPASGFLVDHRHVEYRNLSAVVEAGYLSAVISTKLQKILMYSEVVIKLRKLIKDNQWCFEDVTLFSHLGYSMCDRLGKVLQEWDAMNAHYMQEFGADAEVPPRCAVREFDFVRLETEKLSYSLELNSLLTDGGVAGRPLGLLISPVDTGSLQRSLASVSKRFRAHELRGTVLELYSLAGHEAMKIHAAVQALRLPYLREALPAGAVGIEAQVRSAGVEEAVAAAVDNVKRLSSGPYRLQTEWVAVDESVAQAQHIRLLRINGLGRSLDLLVAEGFIRSLIADSLALLDPIVDDFNASCALRRSSDGEGAAAVAAASPRPPALARIFQEGSDRVEAAVNQLHVLCLHYETLNSRGIPDSVKLLVRRCPHTRVVYHSLFVLMHLLRAEVCGHYEPLHRGWQGAHLDAPRIEELRTRRLDGTFTLQALLRRTSTMDLNSKLGGVVVKLIASVQDEVSYMELCEGAAEGRATGSVGRFNLEGISTERLHTALQRAEEVGTADARVLRLRLACRCVHELRSHLRQGSAAEAFESLDDFLCGGRRSFAQLLHKVYGADFNVPAEVADEFSLLALYVCDRYWQLLAEHALLIDGFSGHRFIANMSSVGWARLDSALALLDTHTSLSHYSSKLAGLCHSVRRLRFEVATGAGLVEVHHCRPEKPPSGPGSSSIREGTIRASRHGQLQALCALAGDCIRRWNDCQIELGVQTDEDFATVSFMTEMILVEEHCMNVTAGMAMEAALGVQVLWFSPSGGLQLLQPVLANLLSALQAAEALKWRRDGSGSLESWWLAVLRAARKVTDVAAVVEKTGTQFLRPGTEAFESAEAVVAAAEVALREIVDSGSSLHHSLNSHGLYAQLPKLLSLHADLRSALSEHAHVVKLKSYLSLDTIIESHSNGAGKFDLDIVLGASDEFSARKADFSDYDSFVAIYTAAIENVAVVTNFAQTVQHLATLGAKLLQAVHWRRYDEALASAALIRAADMFSVRPPHVDLVVAHCSLLRKARVLERAMLCCLLPCVPGWSRLAAAPLLAHAVNDGPVLAALADITDEEAAGSAALDELREAAQHLLKVVAAVRAASSSWQRSSEQQGGPSGFFAQQLLQRYPAVSSATAPPSLTLGIGGACSALRNACLAHLHCRNLSAGMKDYLEEVVSQVEREGVARAFEEKAAGVFARCQITGSAGQLLFSSQAAAALQQLADDLAGPHPADSCYEVDRARQSALLLKLAIGLLEQGAEPAALEAHVRLMEVLATRGALQGEEQLCEQHMQGRIEHPSTLLAFERADLDEYLALTLDSVRSGPHYLQELVLSSAAAENSARSAEFSAVSAACEACLGVGVSAAHRLRRELGPSLLLLRGHLMFLEQYASFGRAVYATPASGSPGELDSSAVHFTDLSMLVDALSCEELAAVGPAARLLCATAQCIYRLRRGQCTSNVDLLRSGVLELHALRLQELAYLEGESSPLIGQVRAPGEPLAFLLLFEAEAELAEADLHERDLLALLSRGVQSKGASLSDTDEGASLRHAELAAALTACGQSAPQSAEGQLLLRTAEVLAPLRESVSKHRWLHLQEWAHATDIGAIAAPHMAEVYAALKTAYVWSAMGKARKAYSNGCLRRLKLASRKDVVDFMAGELDEQPAHEAVEAFNKVRDEWHTAATLEHRNTCRLLYTLRLDARKGSWLVVLDTARFALDTHRSAVQHVSAEGLTEICFALELSAHHVSCEALRGALADGRCGGSVGETDTTAVSPTVVRVALDLSRALGSTHPEVKALEEAAEAVLAVREAQLCGRWVRSDKQLGGEAYETVERMVASAVLETSLLPASERSTYYSAEEEASLDYSTYGVRQGRVEEASGGRGDAARSTRAIVDKVLESDHDLQLAYAPAQLPPAVEDVLGALTTGSLALEAQEELIFAQSEVAYRRIIVGLLAAMRTRGVCGEPGAIIDTGLRVHELEDAVAAALASPQLSGLSHCRYLLRDASLLLRLRQSYRDRAWRPLHKVVREAEEHNKVVRASGELALPLLLPVWNEVKLIKAELSFQLLYLQFVRLCADTRHARGGEAEAKGEAAEKEVREGREDISALMRALIAAEGAAQLWPSQHFERLLEAINLALELRVYGAFNSISSPREILRRATEIKLRDQANGDVCYTGLLFNEIAEVETTASKVQLLDTLAREVADGQKYLLCPLGCINSQEVDTEKVHLFLQSVEPLVNVLWTPADKMLLALADFIARLRDSVRERNWASTLQMVQRCELDYRGTAIEAEVERIVFEIENDDVCKSLDHALSQGRFLDLVFIAKKISVNRRRSSIAAAAASAAPAAAAAADSTKAPSRARRMSQLPSEFDTCLDVLGIALEQARALKNRSMLANTYITAGTMVFEMRAEASVSHWREVEALVAQAQRLPTLPQQSLEEFAAVRAGLAYRSISGKICDALLRGHARRGVQGMDFTGVTVGELPTDLALFSNTLLRGAPAADASARLLHDFATQVCALRQAVLQARFLDEDLPVPVVERASPEELSVEYLLGHFRIGDDNGLDALKNALGIGDDIDLMSALEIDAQSSSDWILRIWRTVSSVKEEMELLSRDVLERRQRLRLVVALETFPPVVHRFLASRAQDPVNKEDLNYASPLRQALEPFVEADGGENEDGSMSTASIEATYAEDMARLLMSAKLALRFRMALNEKNLEAFDSLLALSIQLELQGELSDTYGVLELRAYRAVASTGELAREQLASLLGRGQVRGHLDSALVHDIETQGLAKAASSLQQLLQGTGGPLSSLDPMLSEAQLVLAVRLSVKAGDWTRTFSLIDAWRPEGAPVESRQELLHVRDMCRWRDLQAHLEHFFCEHHMLAGGAHYTGLLLKIPFLEDLLERMNALLQCGSALLPAGGSPFADQAHVEAQRDTVAAVLNLFKALCDEKYDEELVATGHFQSSGCPLLTDDLLKCFFDFVRQHEVSVRLQDVHRQLELLGLAQRRSIVPLQQLLLDLKYGSAAAQPAVPAKTTTRRRVTVIGSDGSAIATAAATATGAAPASRGRRSSIGQIASRQGAGKRVSVFGGAGARARTRSVHIFSAVFSVAAVLSSTDWASFPKTVREVFDAARSDLIDRVIRLRLAYACTDCSVSIDATGNIRIPSYASQLLEIVLYDIRRCARLALRYGCSLAWSEETSLSMLSAHALMTYRTLFIDDNLEALVREMQAMGYLDSRGGPGAAMSSLALATEVVTEVAVMKRFCLEYVAESAIKDLLRYLCQGPAALCRYDSSTCTAPEVHAVQALLLRSVEGASSAYYAALQRLARALCRAVQLAALHKGDEQSMGSVHDEALAAVLSGPLAAVDDLPPLLQEALWRMRTKTRTPEFTSQNSSSSSPVPAVPTASNTLNDGDVIKGVAEVFSEIAGISLHPSSIGHVALGTLKRLADCTMGMCSSTSGFSVTQPLWAVAACTVQIVLENDLEGAPGSYGSMHVRSVPVRSAVAEFLEPFRLDRAFGEEGGDCAYEPYPRAWVHSSEGYSPSILDLSRLLQSLKSSMGDFGAFVGEGGVDLEELDRRHATGVADILEGVRAKLAEMVALLERGLEEEVASQPADPQMVGLELGRRKTLSLLRGLKISISN